MSLASRILNVFRRNRINREIDEELASHLEEAVERGRQAEEARRALGSLLRHREESRDVPSEVAGSIGGRCDNPVTGRPAAASKLDSILRRLNTKTTE